jgi:hypothetical protein
MVAQYYIRNIRISELHFQYKYSWYNSLKFVDIVIQLMDPHFTCNSTMAHTMAKKV